MNQYQIELLESLERIAVAMERQASATERIAIALEKRGMSIVDAISRSAVG